MKIRRAQSKDSKVILSMLRKTPELQGYGEMDSVYSLDYVVDCIKDKKMNLVLIAQEANKIVGLLIAEIWERKKYSFFVNFVVIPEFQSKRIGTKLYEEYEKYCKKKRLRTITALVQTSNKVMHKFCEKRNFKRGHELYFYEKDL